MPFLLNTIWMASLELCKEAALTRGKERGSDPFSLRFKIIGSQMNWDGAHDICYKKEDEGPREAFTVEKGCLWKAGPSSFLTEDATGKQ